MARRITITPLLDVGGGEDPVAEAVERIRAGSRANVATLDDAREVLRVLGLDEAEVEDRIHFGLTGEVLDGRPDRSRRGPGRGRHATTVDRVDRPGSDGLTALTEYRMARTDALARRIAEGLRGVDGTDALDTGELVRFVVDEVRRAVEHPLEVPSDGDVAARWSDALGGFYSAESVRDLLGGVSKQAVSKRRDLLALRTGRGRVAYPKAQFRRGRPAPGMADVLAAVPEAVTDRWSLAGWLAAPNRHLGGDAPFDALHDGRADAVAELAAHGVDVLPVPNDVDAD